MKVGLIVMLLVLVAGLGYTLTRIWQILPFSNTIKGLLFVIPFMAIASFIIYGSGLIDKLPLNFASFVYELGTSWPMILLYLALIFGVLDIAKLAHILPETFLRKSVIGSASIFIFVTALFVYGNINYKKKVRMPITLTTQKQLPKAQKIVMISDVHLGYHNRKEEFKRWVQLINNEKPDIVLISGDIIDGNLRPLWEENMAQEFRNIKAPIYACLGNHEYIGGEQNSEKFYKDAGITLLRDSAATINGINIIGRDDRTNGHRKTLHELTKGIDKGLYTIVLDHQPYHLEQSEREGIDFQLSGHTHYGQVWPISWIEDLIYEKAYGPLTKGKTQYFVTSGIGIWGGKFRIGTQSEYLVAELSNR